MKKAATIYVFAHVRTRCVMDFLMSRNVAGTNRSSCEVEDGDAGDGVERSLIISTGGKLLENRGGMEGL